MTYIVSVKARSEREALISKRVKVSEEYGQKIYDFRSETYSPKVISLPINLPVYRMENCRTFSAQQTKIAQMGLNKDYFTKGQELANVQQDQHEILLKLAKQGSESVTPIIDVLYEKGQRGEILITSTGNVVNGNRRLCAMRELMNRKDGSIDNRFTNVRCAVLPPDATRDEIDDIEADLQAKPQTKLSYDWIGDARLIRRQVGKGRSTKEVAKRLRRSNNEIENVLQALDEADLYLSEWLNRPGEYDRVKEGQQIFADIPKNIANKDPNQQNARRAIAWSIYKNRDRISGRVYRLNPAFGKLAPQVLDIFEKQISIDGSQDEADEDDDFDIEVDIDPSKDASKYAPIIEALRDEDNVEDLIEACETAIELAKGQASEQAALRALSQVSAKIMGIDTSKAGTETLPAILKQIKTIRASLDKVEISVQARQANAVSGDVSGSKAP